MGGGVGRGREGEVEFADLASFSRFRIVLKVPPIPKAHLRPFEHCSRHPSVAQRRINVVQQSQTRRDEPAVIPSLALALDTSWSATTYIIVQYSATCFIPQETFPILERELAEQGREVSSTSSLSSLPFAVRFSLWAVLPNNCIRRLVATLRAESDGSVQLGCRQTVRSLRNATRFCLGPN